MSQREQFRTRLGFILTTAGSAIGLGAIWKFPYVAGKNGGGAFFFIFIFFTFVLALPLMMAEFAIGRTAGADAVTSFKKIAPGTKWYGIGILGMVTTFILLSFYSVIGGWIITYLGKIFTGELIGLQSEEYALLFQKTIENPWLSLSLQFIFILMTIIVVGHGIQNGIERASKIMMPALAILFLILVIRSVTLDGAVKGMAFLFQPDFSKLTSKAVLDAMGQSFFTLSIGVSVMITYSSYLPKTTNLPRSALSVVSMNLLVVILSGLSIFPAVFSFGLDPDAGPVLLFNVLPTIFSQLPFGMFFFAAFLIVFFFAALTSAFSMLEIIVSVLSKGHLDKRKKYAWMIGIAIFIFGIPSALSYGVLSDVTVFGKSFFDLADYAVSNVLMPLGSLLIAIFVSWKMEKSLLFDELKRGSKLKRGAFQAWYYILRYVAPVLIVIVMLDVLGVWRRVF